MIVRGCQNANARRQPDQMRNNQAQNSRSTGWIRGVAQDRW
jgi:hypothetical protein